MTKGQKALNLAHVPRLWVPQYFVLDSAEIASSEVDETARKILERCEALNLDGIIIRSSAGSETLNQRGRFDSHEVRGTPSFAAIRDVVRAMQAQAISSQVEMGLIVQQLLTIDQKGHLSNERRVSPTRNQWEVEVEQPEPDSFRTNSQRDAPALQSQALIIPSSRSIRRLFGSLGSWANGRFESRVHIEWVMSAGQLWVVQIDLEDDAPDDGVDPRSVSPSKTKGSRADAKDPIYHWSEFTDLDFRKIKSTRLFSQHTLGPVSA